MKRPGPDLKMPDLKTPDFLADLFYDLHDRRLLAPIVLVVVAIAAVPFLLGGGSKAPPAEPAAGIATSSVESETARAASLTVVEAKPGLRDYRKRLADRRPTNPFKQRYTAPSTAGAELNQTESSSSSSISRTVTTGGSSEKTTVSSETTTSSPASTPSSSPANTSPSQPSPGGGKHHLTFYTWGIDVRIAKSASDDPVAGDNPEPGTKHKVLPQTSLPGPKAPVVTYMGLSRKAAQKHAARALLLVSDDVRSISGEPTCVSPGEGDVCQLLEVEPGVPITFVYGTNETRYTIKLLKIELVVTGHS
jgi:hypothetical protein